MPTVTNGPEPTESPPEPHGNGALGLCLVLVAILFIAMFVRNLGPNISAVPGLASQSQRLENALAAQKAGDQILARKILESLAVNNNAEAQFRLGRMFEIGTAEGAPDIEKAAAWYKKAAASGIARAKARLGHIYLEGVGVLQNFAKARTYLSQAADDGDPGAQFDLARLWEHGWGGEKNLPTAYAWFEYAARQGFEPAVKARDRLLKSLNLDQIAEGQALLRNLRGSVSQPPQQTSVDKVLGEGMKHQKTHAS
jgi:TPR repeat protein